MGKRNGTDNEYGERISLFSRLIGKIKDFIYDLQVKVASRNGGQRQKTLHAAKVKDLIFYIGLIALPILQISIFYFGVNFRSFFLAFQKYNPETMQFEFAGWVNFDNIFFYMTHENTLLTCIKNSILAYVVTTGVSLPLCLLFSYYIYKKFFAHKFFKVFLFIPSIIPSMILSTMFLYFANYSLPDIMGTFFGIEMKGLFASGSEVMLITLLVYGIFTGCGGGVIMYTSAMSSIDSSIIEAAQIDGASSIQEFFHIVLPLIFPTLSTFVTVGVAGLFTNQLGLFSLFGADGAAYVDCWTIGYYLYMNTVNATSARYPELAAYGMMLTVIAVPLVYGMKFLLAKLGPKMD